MTLAHGASIVTDGLTMLFDAANPRSYPGSGSTWNDISGNRYSSTLINSPTYNATNDGYLSFDGSTQYASVTANIPLSGFTMICWIYSADTQATYTGLLENRQGANLWGVGFGSNNQLGFQYNLNINPVSLYVPNNQWCMVAMSANTTSVSIYLNQSSVTTAQSQTSFTFTGLLIGNDTYHSGRYFNGNFSSVLFYNTALTNAQVAQNFEAYRGRYGI